jgi:uncharacterized protein YndB with AHSA1/START domain
MCKVSVEFVLDIQAKPEKVWDILADVEAWPKWQGTDFVKLGAPAPIKEGSVFEANLGGMRWNITVTKAERPQRIIWVGKRPGLKGVHEWEFQEREEKTIATTRETMSGWMLIPLYFMARSGLSKTDSKWLADLKVRAESS